MFKNKRNLMGLALLLLILIIGGCGNDTSKEQPNAENADNSNAADSGEHTPPSVDDLDPEDPMTEAILYGEKVFNETDTVLPENVGNELSCQSCHANGGLSQSSSMVGVVADYPQYRAREGVTFTLEDRINGCMIRSMNGEMIESDSDEMRGMIAYLTYISQGVEIGAERPWVVVNMMEEVPEPDITIGEDLYVSKNCMTCHATDGSGTGANSGPALWGDNSFNDGAGMTRLSKMAGYIQNNMPIGSEYDLTDQEAADLAAYILAQDRPIFAGHADDFPHGKRPTDFMTEERRGLIQAGEFDWFEMENVVDRMD